ncbi:MAG: YifB family Mg chelatase-like AAA ATPase [Candidatus Omnitrophica bacterium]|nr:YifB family Mg chelatase-like AAA ATPase [Candidatus Omnitrophota bacterium]
MLAKVETAAVVGLSAVPVTVEVDVSDGLPGMTIVGLPDATVKESKERIRSAVKNTQYAWPQTRATVNLAPADVRKEGSAFDLPMAMGLLAASRQLDPELFQGKVILGELALDGAIRPIPGALAVAMGLKNSGKKLLLPAANASEAAVVGNVEVYPLRHLHQAIAFLKGEEEILPCVHRWGSSDSGNRLEGPDFSEVKGQTVAKRAVEVAVAGGHNLLLFGPPGAGKSMLAQRIPTILPPMETEESLETTLVYSVLGLLTPENPLVVTRPFRSPHPCVSDAGLVGGGVIPKPGEISLAHHGVLYLDEFPEFERGVLENLRQPLEEGRVTVARAHGSVTFPAQFILVASMNPCPCGFSGDTGRRCVCSPSQIQRYRTKISGPLLDRIDIHLEVPAVPLPDLTSETAAEPSAAIRGRVGAARARQKERFREEPALFCNARMRHRHLRRFCRLSSEGKELIRRAIHSLGLSARAYDRILKVSRTIADLAGSDEIQPEHLAEAIQYRSLDRSL